MGVILFGFSPYKAVWEKHMNQRRLFGVPASSETLLFPPPLHPGLMCQQVKLCSLPARRYSLPWTCQIWRLAVSQAAIAPSSLSRWMWIPDQTYRRKQASMGNRLGGFSSPRHGMSVQCWDWISEDIYSPASLQRNSLMAQPVMRWMQCWCVPFP